MTTRQALPVVTFPLAAVLLIAIAATANWRVALITGLTAAAILLTRMRWAPHTAVATLVGLLILAATGNTA